MKQYIVIGCGRFGSSVASTMHLLGHQVMAIDKNEDSVQSISDKVT
ncbi:MAG: NAD-binding protein, partial [Clostridioides difficile]